MINKLNPHTQPNTLKRYRHTLSMVSLIVILLGLLSGCNKAPPQQPISFAKQIMPILAANCLSCHNHEGEGYKKSGLNMENYADLMKGTQFGPVVIPGNAVASNLAILIDGKAPNLKMPHGTLQLLPKDERDLIKLWINQGAVNN